MSSESNFALGLVSKFLAVNFLLFYMLVENLEFAQLQSLCITAACFPVKLCNNLSFYLPPKFRLGTSVWVSLDNPTCNE